MSSHVQAASDPRSSRCHVHPLLRNSSAESDSCKSPSRLVQATRPTHRGILHRHHQGQLFQGHRLQLIFPPKLHLRLSNCVRYLHATSGSLLAVNLGFAPVGGDPGWLSWCGPVIAQQLQQLYNDVLCHFDQVYISSIVA